MAFKDDITWLQANEPVQGDVASSTPGAPPTLEGVSNRPGKEIHENTRMLRYHFTEPLWENYTYMDRGTGASSYTVSNGEFVVIEEDQPRSSPNTCLLYTSPSPRDRQKSRMPSSA